ncbi:MAG: radical SAM domain protein [Gammaproteobacteria bacterium]|nr:radical SAM domain protein [Gammaproteobacteria bacterium]
MGIKEKQVYQGFELGPIRPPSEARSLLLRVTRNCAWNKCTFCKVYKRTKFSFRPIEHIIQEIDTIHEVITIIRDILEQSPHQTVDQIQTADDRFSSYNRNLLYLALDWWLHGNGAVFLQDADSLILKPDQLAIILEHLRYRFPWINRITSYARSHTINRISGTGLKLLALAGLNRIHIGMESGSDRVLNRINKGVTKQGHIDAGQLVKSAGIELSEYVMPGLGGAELSEEHALETADALNHINPDFIRLRSLTIMPDTPLYGQLISGEFKKNTELQTIVEIRSMIEHLTDIASIIKSDHNHNLLQEIDGTLPQDKHKLLQVLDAFLHLSELDQVVFQLGRRMGYFQDLHDLQSPARRTYLSKVCSQNQLTSATIDQFLEQHTPLYM